MPATRTSEEGGTRLACRARSVRRSAVKSGASTSFFAAARPQIVRVRCASGGRVDELSDVLTLCSWARPLLTAVMYVQLGTSCPTSRTIGEWEQATK